jgi:hypothetical protein
MAEPKVQFSDFEMSNCNVTVQRSGQRIDQIIITPADGPTDIPPDLHIQGGVLRITFPKAKALPYKL